MRDAEQARAEHRAAWERLPPTLRDQAVAIFLEKVPANVRAQVLEDARSNGLWFVQDHFGWGMGIRNLFRTYGLLDAQLPPTPYPDQRGEFRNWDDYYVAVIEGALGLYG